MPEETVELDANSAPISFSMFEWMFQKLPERPSLLEAHPYQVQAYEETGFAVQVVYSEGKMPGFDGYPNEASEYSLTINRVPVRENIRYAKNEVGFIKDGKLVGKIKNLALPVLN